MRPVVIYYSLEGNTSVAALELAAQLAADVFEIKTIKSYPAFRAFKILAGGYEATFGIKPWIVPMEIDFTQYDLVILAFPVWADKPASPVASFFDEHDMSGQQLALLVSSGSGNAQPCVESLAKRLDIPIDATPVLSLREPAKMDAAERATQIQTFATQLKALAVE